MASHTIYALILLAIIAAIAQSCEPPSTHVILAKHEVAGARRLVLQICIAIHDSRTPSGRLFREHTLSVVARGKTNLSATLWFVYSS